MVETADVLSEFPPARDGEARIDDPALKTMNPRLIYCGLTGYGDGGPLSKKGGFAQVLQCVSGIAVFQGAATG
jgi:CoA:oxalate CoA-transferase